MVSADELGKQRPTSGLDQGLSERELEFVAEGDRVIPVTTNFLYEISP